MSGVVEQLDSLSALTSTELRAEWLRCTGSPSPRISPSLLRLALAWEIQARTHGGVSRPTRQRLRQIARGHITTIVAHPGTSLVREWNGAIHVVTIDDKGGIHWRGRSWRSLSEVARAITGTRWSGPAFFGLKRKLAA